ncbi:MULTISPECIES: pyridoxal 5'-phosphate synthase glutaminase subunit PdxT [Thermoactinomyces]|jgi:pyridoxal 5'-phosphate synthase pdxT subunit|uniref:Pyridoxal 5'-phosphate synthase subunit PdxT n=1 Tax=Thermoactinomyces daqus TaxID=1329516 RepID=A0A7W2AH97_9BACL|nr:MULTISPECIES: pyridoxal 5'-phosphate synthase glutaminase subunit PdxT [Thermoactinomyces]MBA4541950.1 pyridoxal 5'-phosphate synthase glutaminase subunit PdxT [Thermoactinomyces daqus]MBH8597949.1 pyridoxal 5'-phosphate synthase glutaminase subunit PdxT [Thermoactinomyces sp. CICC 10523]MBH8607757.1 pyridoxal 5'-phosphate synthase glutaminase subunit PdxT [Thermoactinomyces sp. CICC 10521]
MKIGVLALQGAVREHVRLLEQAGAEAVAVKRVEQLSDLDGLVIPGGESTTISKLMNEYQMTEPIRQMYQSGKPIFGTCAGMILIASRIEGRDEPHLGLMDITVKRNAFGRQRESFEASLDVKGIGDQFQAVFIRAPYIEEVGPGVEILAEVDGKIVAARQGHLLAAAFHPELTDDVRFHAYFIEMVRESMVTNAEV